MFLAQGNPPSLPAVQETSELPSVVKAPQGLIGVADQVLALLLQVAGVLAVAAFIITGVLYLLSFGNEQKMLQAKKNFIWATIGVVLISLMLGLIALVRTLTVAPLPSNGSGNKGQTSQHPIAVVLAAEEENKGTIVEPPILPSPEAGKTETGQPAPSNLEKLNTAGSDLSGMLSALNCFISGTDEPDPANPGKTKFRTECESLGFHMKGAVDILTLLAAIAVGIFFLLNAIQYFLAYGNEEKAHKAKTGLLWATVGIILIILSRVIIYFIYNPQEAKPGQGTSGTEIFGPLPGTQTTPSPQSSPPTSPQP